jgi:hypothetical protein
MLLPAEEDAVPHSLVPHSIIQHWTLPVAALCHIGFGGVFGVDWVGGELRHRQRDG